MRDKREFAIGFTIARGRMDVDRAAIVDEIRHWPDGDYTLTLASGGEKRSKTYEQIKYWWAVPITLIAEHCGYTPAQMHYALLGEWSGWVDGLKGQAIPAKPSMADLSVEEMNDLIDWILTWAPSELGVIVPEPDKNWRQKKGAAA